MNNLVYLESGQAVTDSLMLAEAFGKEHKRVMQDIRELDCSEEFREHHFVPSSYKSAQNKDMPKYTITRDGFTILAMGYTGKSAMAFKERYIQEFNRMSYELQELKDGVQVPDQKAVRDLPIPEEQPEVIPFYDLNQSWEFKPNPVYVSAVLKFPTKDVLLQAVGDIGAIEHEQMTQLFGVQQKHVHSMLCNGELLQHELWLDNRKQVIYTLGLHGCKKVGHKPSRIEHWSIQDVLEKLVFFEFVKHMQGKEPYPVFTIKADKKPFVGRISYLGEEYRIRVMQRPMNRYELPEDETTAVYILAGKEEYAKPLQQKYVRVIQYNYADFMPRTEKGPSKADPFAFLSNLP